jgi:nitrogen fixation protein NifU and related proteins
MIGYGEQILDHYRRPRNEGSLPAPDIWHEDVNPLCGDRVRIEIQLGAGERVAAARFRSDGCILCQGASSILTERITGLTLGAIEALPAADFLGSLQADLKPNRVQCVLLPLDVLRAGIATYRRGVSP